MHNIEPSYFLCSVSPVPYVSLRTTDMAKEVILRRSNISEAYSCVQDSADAIDNMHNAELYGRVLRCNFAQPMKIKGGDKGFSHQPVWADADDWCVSSTLSASCV